MTKRKPKTLTWWKGKCWEQFSKYVRIRDAIRTTGGIDKLVCCTCGKIYPSFGAGCAQSGHFIPGRGNSVLFSERGCHGQCFACNIFLKGNVSRYYKYMQDTYGQEVIEELMRQSRRSKKYLPYELEEMRDEYKRLYCLMLKTKKLHLFGE